MNVLGDLSRFADGDAVASRGGGYFYGKLAVAGGEVAHFFAFVV